MATTNTFPVTPEVLEWVERRSHKTEDELTKKFPKYPEWKAETTHPTIQQLKKLADHTYTHVNLLLRKKPIPDIDNFAMDFRTKRMAKNIDLEPNLRDVVFWASRRQVWMEEYLIENKQPKLDWVGTINPEKVSAETAVVHLQNILNLTMYETPRPRTYLRELVELTENARVMVNISGTVGITTSRVLDTDVFRGFSLSSKYAPLIFINGRDSTFAKIFTLLHEWGHLLIGKPGIDNPRIENQYRDNSIERWCNRFASAFLVPECEVHKIIGSSKSTDDIKSLSTYFQVSRFVILIRLKELELISKELYEKKFVEAKQNHYFVKKRGSGGGNHYYNQRQRVGRLFARTLLDDTFAYNTSFTKAANLLDENSTSLDKYAEYL